MIYIIKPYFFYTQIIEDIRLYISKYYPEIAIKTKYSHKFIISNQQVNTYFIINKTKSKIDESIQIAHQIRKKDYHGHIILITNQINDYTKLFRSHIGFLGIINENSYSKKELHQYLDFALEKITP